MTPEEFKIFWNSDFVRIIPMQMHFRHDDADRWFRIHSLPGAKRYPGNEHEWKILLNRQNKIITDLFGNGSAFIIVTGEYYSDKLTELHPIKDAGSVSEIDFVASDPVDLYKLNPEVYEAGQFYKPLFSEQTWHENKFDSLLKDIAEERLKALFFSVEKEIMIMPYDGGVDFILNDPEARNRYRNKYHEWSFHS